MFGRCHPQAVGGFDIDDACDEWAAVGLVGRQPRCRVTVPLLLVYPPDRSLQIKRIIGEVGAREQIQLLRAGLPGIGQCDDVIDLNVRRRSRTALELDGGAGVGVIEDPAENRATIGSWLEDHIDEISAQDVIAGVTSVMAQGHCHIVSPGVSELPA